MMRFHDDADADADAGYMVLMIQTRYYVLLRREESRSREMIMQR